MTSAPNPARLSEEEVAFLTTMSANGDRYLYGHAESMSAVQKLLSERASHSQRVAKLRAALEWYAAAFGPSLNRDDGRRAREALVEDEKL